MKQILAICAGSCLIAPASGQVISSPDGRWTGIIDPNNTGQLTEIIYNGSSDVFEILFYEASLANGNQTWRVEQNYGPVSQSIGVNRATFVSMRNDGRIRLDTRVVMFSDPRGGALFTTTYTNVTAASVERLRPFFYADVDAEPGSGGDTAHWLAFSHTSAIEQFDTHATWWIGVAEIYAGWEIAKYPDLRTVLDGGVSVLSNAGGGGLANWTGALSGALVSLNPGESVSMTVGVGGSSVGQCPCVCDIDTSSGPRVCDLIDFTTFAGLFVQGDPCACDIDTSTGWGVCDLVDFTTFAGQFVAGCP